MPVTRAARSRIRSRRWLGRDGLRAIVSVAALAVLFGVGVYLNGGITISKFPSKLLQTGPEDNLTTASILFVPVLGKHCRQRWIDNATWYIRDGGVVDCDKALSPDVGGSALNQSSARLDALREAFRQR